MDGAGLDDFLCEDLVNQLLHSFAGFAPKLLAALFESQKEGTPALQKRLLAGGHSHPIPL